MPSLNAAAVNHMADAVVSGWSTATLTIFAGATPLASHSISSLTNVGGTVTAGEIPSVLNDNSGRATSAVLSQAGRALTLSVGIEDSGAELVVAKKGATPDLTDLDYVAGGTSTVGSITIVYPAS